MKFPSRVWSISRYVDSNGNEVDPGPEAIALYSSKEPTQEDKDRRNLAILEADRRVDAMKERIFKEDTRRRTEDLRR
jgi:hypothetical protein